MYRKQIITAMSNLKSQFDELVSTFNDNYDKFSSKQNAAAGTRARKALSEIAQLSKNLRAEIQETKNASK